MVLFLKITSSVLNECRRMKYIIQIYILTIFLF